MIPTWLTGLALGVGDTAMSAVIKSLALWITGSMMFGGNIFFDTTNNRSPKVFVDNLQVMQVSSGAVINAQTNGYQSGAVIKADSRSLAQFNSAPCSGTGGTNGIGGYYTFCNVKNPSGSTGSLVWYRLACDRPQYSVAGLSGGFLKSGLANNTRTVSALNLFTRGQMRGFETNRTVGTGGSVFTVGSGQLAWNPDDRIVLQTSTVITNGVSPDCRFDYQLAKNYAF